MTKQTVLYCDAFNLFYRGYSAVKTINERGEANGGLVGFILQLQKMVEKFCPSKVIISFDGANGSSRRRLIYPNYKGKKARRKRTVVIGIGDQQNEKFENEDQQLKAIYEFISLLPVDIIILPNWETDDVIAYLVRKNPQYQNIICSTDQDYLQLLDENTFVWSPVKKILFTSETFSEYYQMTSGNYLYLRAVSGDVSDHLEGVKGIGQKTVLDLLPEIREQRYNSFQEFWQAIENVDNSKSKKLKLLKESKNIAFSMYKLMLLDSSNLNLKAIEQLRQQLEEQQQKVFSKTTLKIHTIKHHLEEHIRDFEIWSRPFMFIKQDIVLNT